MALLVTRTFYTQHKELVALSMNHDAWNHAAGDLQDTLDVGLRTLPPKIRWMTGVRRMPQHECFSGSVDVVQVEDRRVAAEKRLISMEAKLNSMTKLYTTTKDNLHSVKVNT